MKICYNVDLYFSHAYFSFSHSHGIGFSLHLSHLLIQLLQQTNHPSLIPLLLPQDLLCSPQGFSSSVSFKELKSRGHNL